MRFFLLSIFLAISIQAQVSEPRYNQLRDSLMLNENAEVLLRFNPVGRLMAVRNMFVNNFQNATLVWIEYKIEDDCMMVLEIWHNANCFYTVDAELFQLNTLGFRHRRSHVNVDFMTNNIDYIVAVFGEGGRGWSVTAADLASTDNMSFDDLKEVF